MYMTAAVVGVVSTLLAAVQDMRTRLVPNWLSYTTIATGVFIHFAHALHAWSITPVVHVALGLVTAWLVAALFFYTGQWGGGDAKLLIGVGALIGLDFTGVPLFFIFLLNMFIAGAMLGIVWSAVLAFRHWSAFRQEFVTFIRADDFTIYRWVNLGTAVTLVTISFYTTGATQILLVVTAVALYAMLYLYAAISVVEDVCMYSEVDVESLIPGDWVDEDVKDGDTVIYSRSDLGVSEDSIEEIAKVRDTVRVKEGIPFIPSFFIAFLTTVLLKNWLLFVV